MGCRVAMEVSGCEDQSLLGCFSLHCLRCYSIVARHLVFLLRRVYEEPCIFYQ